MNVEISSTIKAVKYIYKYNCKGSDRILLNVANQSPCDLGATTDKEVNEIEQYRSGRWISAPESPWRIFRFPLSEMHPPVIQMHLQLENYQPVTFKHKQLLSNVLDNPLNKKIMLTELFSMNQRDPNAQRQNCTYVEFPDFFVWLPMKKMWKLCVLGNSIGRVVSVEPIEGEQYFLRLLLSKVRGPTSYAHLRTVNGQVFPTYREVALASGLLAENSSQEQCMSEAALYSMPSQLRKLVADLLVHTCPNDQSHLWSTFEEHMSSDFARKSNMTSHLVIKRTLQHIISYLIGMSKSLKHYGIFLVGFSSILYELENPGRELSIENCVIVSKSDLDSIKLLNAEQKTVFTLITAVVYSNTPGVFFIDGPGGTRKTFLYRVLLADVMSKGHVALSTSTSGIAASLFPRGRTAHSRFKIPIDLDDVSTCRRSKQTSLALLIKETKLILWDEAPMAKRTSIQALNDLLKDLMDSVDIFGGKVLVLEGDFRQTLPVVEKCTKTETILYL